MSKKTKKIIIGNWKMNPPTAEDAKKLFSDLKKASKNFKTKVVICTPSIFLPLLKEGNGVYLGAQDVSTENPKKGSHPFTGEISAEMLRNLGVRYVILGHSERRSMGETNEIVNKKIKVSLASGLMPVVCVGEKVRDHDGGFFEELRNQINATFLKIKKADLAKVIIAYEPIWAIGKSDKENITGEDLHQMVIFIRKVISEIYGKRVAFDVPVIYGGSVSADDIFDLVSNGQVDGILPGRASLDPKEMKEILELL